MNNKRKVPNNVTLAHMTNLLKIITILSECCLPHSSRSFPVRGNWLVELTKVADSSFLNFYTLSTSFFAFAPPPGTKVTNQSHLHLWHQVHLYLQYIHLLQIFHNWSKGVFNHICTTLATYSVISGTCLPPPHVALVMVLEMGAWEPITIAKMQLLWRIYAVKWDNRG